MKFETGFKIVFIFFILLLFASLSFAVGDPPPTDWIPTAAAAIMLSLTIVTLLYMVGYGLSLNELRILCIEEYYQIIVTALMVGIFIGASIYLNSLSDAFEPGATNLQEAAVDKVGDILDKHEDIYGSLRSFGIILGQQSSKSFYCALQGMGYTISSCGSFRALTSPLALAFQAMSVSITELSSLLTFLNFGKNYAFTLLLPAGIILRTLKITRGAGGLLIGMAAAVYFFVPVSVIFMDTVLDGYESAPGRAAWVDPTPDSLNTGFWCYEEQTGEYDPDGLDYAVFPLYSGVSDLSDYTPGSGISNADTARGVFGELRNKSNTYIYHLLIRATLTTIVALLTFIGSLRWISKIAGADVDVSALARIA